MVAALILVQPRQVVEAGSDTRVSGSKRFGYSEPSVQLRFSLCVIAFPVRRDPGTHMLFPGCLLGESLYGPEGQKHQAQARQRRD